MSVKDNVKTEKAVKGNGLVSFFKDVKAEIKKITWPSKDETKKAFIAVITFTLMYTILVGGFDFIFRNLFDMFLKLK